MKPVLRFNKKPKQIKPFLVSPTVLALGITTIIIFFLPGITKYKLEKIEEFHVDRFETISYYDDLDFDGNSEYILSFTNKIGEHAVKILDYDNRLINQWNFYRKASPRKNDCSVSTADFNHDGFKELFAISWENDSIFLDIINPLNPGGYEKRNIFIDTVAKYSEDRDFSASVAQFIDFNRDGFKEAFICINAGFSIYPRKFYLYDIKNDRLQKSPLVGVSLNEPKIVDLDGDQRYEIVCNTTGFGNIHPYMNIPYPDSSSYLIVFDDKLNFKFVPVEFDFFRSTVKALPIQFGENKQILALFVNSGVQKKRNELYIFNIDGELVARRILPENFENQPELIQFADLMFYETAILKTESGHLYIVNEDLSLTNMGVESDIRSIHRIDLNNDSKDEFISIDVYSGYLTITQKNFAHPVTYNLNSTSNIAKISIKKMQNKPQYIFLQYGSKGYFFNYYKNPLYQFSWIIVLSIFILIWFFIYSIKRIYLSQLLKQQAIEHQITELQFNSISNQINPHFIFNAMNSITTAIYKENKDEAYDFGIKFSELMREALLSSDKISRTLEQEISFVRNYLDLEKFRYKDIFDYKINLDPAVNTETAVPKTIIQTFAENAVKHGMKNAESRGMILITVTNKTSGLEITIEDNGPGRSNFNNDFMEKKTGKGLEIINQIFELYMRLKDVRIRFSFNDGDELNENLGTRVVIELDFMK